MTMVQANQAMEFDDLLEAFQAGAIDGSEFRHEHHVRVAWGLARQHGHEAGLRRMIAGIRQMCARAGHPEAYHHTITRAWFELVADAEDLADGSILFDRKLLSSYYTPERLSEGREGWVEPDLRPLRLPEPGSSESGARPRTATVRHRKL
jgi:hypothetical protein